MNVKVVDRTPSEGKSRIRRPFVKLFVDAPDIDGKISGMESKVFGHLAKKVGRSGFVLTTQAKVAKKLGCSLASVKRAYRGLIELGMIVPAGPGKVMLNPGFVGGPGRP